MNTHKAIYRFVVVSALIAFGYLPCWADTITDLPDPSVPTPLTTSVSPLGGLPICPTTNLEFFLAGGPKAPSDVEVSWTACDGVPSTEDFKLITQPVKHVTVNGIYWDAYAAIPDGPNNSRPIITADAWTYPEPSPFTLLTLSMLTLAATIGCRRRRKATHREPSASLSR